MAWVVLGAAESHGSFIFPLRAIVPPSTTPGQFQLRVGVAHQEGHRALFQEQDRNRRETHLPTLSLALGVGPNSELLVEYPFIHLDEDGRDGDWGSGDVVARGVARLFPGLREWFDSAATIGVKLPNADDEEGFGTDQTDVFVGGTVAKQVGEFRFVGNAELWILGHPRTETTQQDDVLHYALATTWRTAEPLTLLAEIEGIAGSRYGNDRARLRGGAQWTAWSLTWDAGAGVGISGKSGDYEVSLGVAKTFGTPREQPCPPCP